MEAAAAQHAEIAAPGLAPEVAEELLELARAVAHSRERRFAPLASFTAGVAVERLLRARPDLGTEEVVAFLRRVRDAVE